jgi:hypothetical protein
MNPVTVSQPVRAELKLFFFCTLLKNLKIFKVTLRKLQVSHNNSIFFCAFSSGAPNEDSAVSENAGIEPRTVLQVALTVKAASHSHQRQHLVHICYISSSKKNAI